MKKHIITEFELLDFKASVMIASCYGDGVCKRLDGILHNDSVSYTVYHNGAPAVQGIPSLRLAIKVYNRYGYAESSQQTKKNDQHEPEESQSFTGPCGETGSRQEQTNIIA